MFRTLIRLYYRRLHSYRPFSAPACHNTLSTLHEDISDHYARPMRETRKVFENRILVTDGRGLKVKGRIPVLGECPRRVSSWSSTTTLSGLLDHEPERRVEKAPHHSLLWSFRGSWRTIKDRR